MRGASRQALAAARESLDRELASTAGAGASTSTDLLGVARLLGREGSLARALTDPGADSQARVGLVERLFAAQIGEASLRVLRDAVSQRWSSAGNLVDGIELLGVRAAVSAAVDSGVLDQVEDELFRFARIVERSPELTATFSDTSVPDAEKAALARGMLATRANPVTVELAAGVLGSLRGRSAVRALDELTVEVAARRDRRVAVARVAIPLDEGLRVRLAAAVGAAVGHDVRLQVEVDPRVVGGITVSVGDEVLDSSVANRISQVTRALAP